MKAKSSKKKRPKSEAIENAALEVFKEKGFDSTTIDDIVTKAEVGKGTFYLYFKDKRQLLEEIILKKTGDVLEQAMDIVQKEIENKEISQSDKVICVVDYVLSKFETNKEFLEIIHKNIYKGLFDERNEQIINRAVDLFLDDKNIQDSTKAQHILYFIMEMLGAVMYNSIIFSKPFTLDEIKEDLYQTIRNIVDYA